MTDNAQPEKFLQIARSVREDQAAADQLHGALETLYERIRVDPVVNASLASCVKFRTLLKQLLKELDRLQPATEGEAASARAFDPAKCQAVADEWQSLRGGFFDDYRKNKDYLERLALRIVR